jgi:hypothetical protein
MARNHLAPMGDEYGPAMQALTEKQRGFVIGKVHHGLNDRAAATAAGYSMATRSFVYVAHHPAVQAAIEEESRKLMRSEGPKSIRTLVEIRDSKEAKAADRIKAATELLNRGGLHARTEHTLSVEHHMTEAEKDKRILALAAELGLPPEMAQKMLIAPAEFEKNSKGVYEVAKPEPEPVSPERAVAREKDRRFRARQKMTPEERDAELAESRERQRQQLDDYWSKRKAEVTDAEFVDAEPRTTVTEYVDINVSDDSPLSDLSDVL